MTINITAVKAAAAGVGTSTDGDSTLYALVVFPSLMGCVFIILCLLFFGLAMHKGWNNDLAPRIANRPKEVIKSALLYEMPPNTSKYYYPIVWIVWAYNLTYTVCLNGIPGTGTRKDGWEGPNLTINLDAVILLRFHTLLFKVGVLVAFLCTFILIPVNTTARCNVETFGVGTCAQREINSTGFLKTTIANIPDKIVSEF